MLKGIDPRLTPDLLRVLAAMGHGDEVVIVDVNFPARSTAGSAPVIELAGVTAPQAMELILGLLPLDNFVDAPALRIDLLNRAGKPVAAKLARPIDPRIPAGALRHFSISIVDPPSTAHDLQVAFDTTAKAHADPHATEAVLTPPPVEAEPLPAGAPDALPSHG